MKLSHTMKAHLMGFDHGRSATINALRRRGLIEPWPSVKRTRKALEWVKDQLDRRTENQFGNTSVERINNVDRLVDLYRQTPRPCIYVYAGSRPMLVSGGDGQNPVAVVTHWLLFQIQNNLVSHPFGRGEVIGHKGSYTYFIPEEA